MRVDPGTSALPGGLSDHVISDAKMEKPVVRKLLLACAMTSLILGTAACNTVKGLGRDIESVGEAGDRAVK